MAIHGTLGALSGSIVQTVTGGPFKDEDDLTSNSATHIATQQSIKAYVDAGTAADDITQGDAAVTISTSSGQITIDSPLDIILDAAGDDLFFKADGTAPLQFRQDNSGDWTIKNDTAQKSLVFKTRQSNGDVEVIRLDSANNHSNVIFNEGSLQEFDFRVESGGETHMLYVDGYFDRIGLGFDSTIWNSNRPASRVHIEHTETTTAAAANQLQDFTLFLKNLSTTVNSFAGIAFDVSSEAQVDSIGAAIRAERDTSASTTPANHDANLTFATNDAGDAGLTERMRITRDGLVGIADAAPSHTLDVGGDINLTGGLSFDDGTAVTSIDTNISSVSGADDTLASAKAIKTYVDTALTAEDLDVTTDSGTIDIDLDSETLSIVGTSNEVETSATSTTVTVGLPSNVTIGGTLTATTAVVPTGAGSGTLGTAALTWGNVYLSDDTKIHFGDSQETSIEYDKDGGAVLRIAAPAAGVVIAGTTPTLIIGDAGAEDTKIVYDGNAQDFYVGLDDTDDKLKLGLGSAVGTTPNMELNSADRDVKFFGDIVVDGNRITFGNGDYVENISSGIMFIGTAHLAPSAGDTYDLGSAAYDWRDVYIGRGIQTPDGPLQSTPGAGTGHAGMGSIRLMEEASQGTNYFEIGCKYAVGASNYTVEFPSASGDILVSGYTGAQSVGGTFRVNGGTIYGPPDNLLDIRSDGHMYFRIDDDNDESGKEFRWYDDSTERMTLGQTGDLQIDGDLSVTGNRITFGNSGFIHEEVNGLIHLSENTEIAGTLTIPDYIYHAGDTDTFMHFTTNVWQVYANAASRIQVNSTGVGMMNATPIAGLAVAGKIAASRLGFCGVYDQNEVQSVWSMGDSWGIDTAADDFGTLYGMGYGYSTNGSLPFANEHQIAFCHNGVIGTTLAMDGRAKFGSDVGIGRTPSYRLDVYESEANNYAARVWNDGNGYTYYGMIIQCGRDADLEGTDYYFLRFNDGDGGQVGIISGNGGTCSYGAFTGEHPAKLADGIENLEYGTLMVIQSVSSRQKAVDYVCIPSTSEKQKSVIGVYAGLKPMQPDDDIDPELHTIFALGDGHILVCSEGSDIDIGDFICSSNTSGYGMKQDDDLLHNYTVAKASESVDWSSEPESTKLIACTYHAG